MLLGRQMGYEPQFVSPIEGRYAQNFPLGSEQAAGGDSPGGGAVSLPLPGAASETKWRGGGRVMNVLGIFGGG